MTRKNLVELKTAAEQAIQNGVSKEAHQLYRDARDLHRTAVVEPFLKGWVANLEREGATGTQVLPPSAVTKKILNSEEDAVRAVAAFNESPAAMQAIKAGVEGEYRSAVVTGGTSHAKWMADHQFELAALDKAGLEITSRLENLGGSAQKLADTAAELKASGKAIPGKVNAEFELQNKALDAVSKDLNFKFVKDLRSSVVKDESTMNQALRRMDAPAKAALARGVMQDALAAKDPLAHLAANERPIMAALRAADPATATKIFANAKEGARVKTLIDDAQKAFSPNMLDAGKRIGELTKGLPEVRAIVQKITREIEQGATFDQLASTGVTAGGGAGGLATASAGAPVMALSRTAALANAVMRRMKGLTDDKLAAQIGVELANSPSAAAMIARAQAKVSPAAAKTASSLRGNIAPAATALNQLTQK
jgi:hypothetical protein